MMTYEQFLMGEMADLDQFTGGAIDNKKQKVSEYRKYSRDLGAVGR